MCQFVELCEYRSNTPPKIIIVLTTVYIQCWELPSLCRQCKCYLRERQMRYLKVKIDATNYYLYITKRHTNDVELQYHGLHMVVCVMMVVSKLPAVELVLMILYMFTGRIVYTVVERSTVLTICKNISASNSIIFKKKCIQGKNLPVGYVIGWNMLAYIQDDNSEDMDFYVKLFTNSKQFEQITKKEKLDEIQDTYIEPVDESDKGCLKLYYRSGCYRSMYWMSRTIDISTLFPTERQSLLIEQIVDMYFSRKRGVTVFLHGPPGTGKTTLAMLLALHMNATFGKTCNPSEPADQFGTLIERIEPTPTKPHVQLFDEIDIMFNNVHNNKIKKHPEYPIEVFDKSTMNRFLDDLVLNKNVIIICTSNQTKDWIDTNIDPCYLRQGRFHMYLTLPHNKSE